MGLPIATIFVASEIIKHLFSDLERADILGKVTDNAGVLVCMRSDVVDETASPSLFSKIMHNHRDLEPADATDSIGLCGRHSHVYLRAMGLTDTLNDVIIACEDLADIIGALGGWNALVRKHTIFVLC